MYLRNLVYILRHKWWVFLACCRLGIPWRGLVHDLSKLLPDEFGPYARWFYGGGQTHRAETGADSPEFVLALRRHFNRNDHHWEWWVLPGDRALPMSDGARREMLADWWGAGRGRADHPFTWADVATWYQRNRQRIVLHPETRGWVEAMLDIAD